MKTVKIIATILIPLLVGLLGSFPTLHTVDSWWFITLAKPPGYPPDWVFGPVWTILYILMGIALWQLWKNGIYRQNRPVVILFFTQLLLNCFWSFLFFGLQDPLLALFDIVLLWLLIIVTILLAGRISRTAAWLLLPYLLWVTFAAYLNTSIVILNG